MAGSDKLQNSSLQMWPKLAICTVFFLFAIAAFTALSCINTPSPSQTMVEDLKLPEHGDTALLTGVVSPADEGRDHIWPDHPVEYQTMPPTSG
ncbi:MAG: hypothetical protein WCP43_06410, partial [Dehalococcoidia bacterium]